MVDMEKWIGMNNIKTVLLSFIENKDIYCKGKVSIPNLIIMMDSGNGQTYTTEAIIDVLIQYGLQEFHGLDNYLEYKPECTMNSIEWMFSDIRDNAIYENDYKGVVTVDVSKLSDDQDYIEYFMNNIQAVARNAMVIFYCPTTLTGKGRKLINLLKENLNNVILIDSYKFTMSDFAEIIMQNILDRGIEIINKEKTFKVICETLADKEVTCVKEAVCLADQLVFWADYTTSIPKLTLEKNINLNQIRVKRYRP